MNEVTTNTIKWKEIAIELELSSTEIDRIAMECRDSIQECFRRVFDRWQRDSRRPFTWDTIIAVLESQVVSENTLAQQLREKFCSS